MIFRSVSWPVPKTFFSAKERFVCVFRTFCTKLFECTVMHITWSDVIHTVLHQYASVCTTEHSRSSLAWSESERAGEREHEMFGNKITNCVFDKHAKRHLTTANWRNTVRNKDDDEQWCRIVNPWLKPIKLCVLMTLDILRTLF